MPFSVDEEWLNYVGKAIINVFYFARILAKNQLFQAVAATAGKQFPFFQRFIETHNSLRKTSMKKCDVFSPKFKQNFCLRETHFSQER